MQVRNYSQQVTNRLMEVKGITSVKDLIVFLDVNEGTFRSWLSRDSLDTRLIIAKCNDENLHYILTGKTTPNSAPNSEKMAGNLAGNLAGNSEKMAGNLADIDNNDEDLGAYKIISSQMVNLLLKETKELNQEIGALKHENTQLRAENAELRAELEECKGILPKTGTEG